MMDNYCSQCEGASRWDGALDLALICLIPSLDPPATNLPVSASVSPFLCFPSISASTSIYFCFYFHLFLLLFPSISASISFLSHLFLLLTLCISFLFHLFLLLTLCISFLFHLFQLLTLCISVLFHLFLLLSPYSCVSTISFFSTSLFCFPFTRQFDTSIHCRPTTASKYVAVKSKKYICFTLCSALSLFFALWANFFIPTRTVL
jgi:hypothetical protein